MPPEPAPPAGPVATPAALRGPGEAECVRCGFCFPACPTYDVLGTEMDNPRGRLLLMRALEEGRIRATAPALRHLDLCLGCRACESECPSGVAYGARLERARETIRGSPGRDLGVRLTEGLVLGLLGLPPGLQRAAAGALALARLTGLDRLAASARLRLLLPVRLAASARLLAAAPRGGDRPAALTPARGTRRLRVGLLLGCVGRSLFGRVNSATIRLLAAAGCEVIVPAGQRCCGALHAHAGDLAGARRLAAADIVAFDRASPLDAIVVNAAGCGSVMKNYAALFEPSGEAPAADAADSRARAAAFAAKVKDVLELLCEIGPPPFTRPVPASAAYHDACHLAHAQGVRIQPRKLLEAVPGLRLVPLEEADRCCGSAGIYNLLQPQAAAAILSGKLGRLRDSGADMALAANPGCLLQIAAGVREAGLPLRVLHPVEVLDEACDPGS